MSATARVEGVGAAYHHNGDDVAARVFLQPIAPPEHSRSQRFRRSDVHHRRTHGRLVRDSDFECVSMAVCSNLRWSRAVPRRDVGIPCAMRSRLRCTGCGALFWIAFGILNLLFSTHVLVEPTPKFPELGFWFIALGAITVMGARRCFSRATSVSRQYSLRSRRVAGALLPASSREVRTGRRSPATRSSLRQGLAFYVASAMMFASAAGRIILPLGKRAPHANVPGNRLPSPIQLAWAEPGVKHGQ